MELILGSSKPQIIRKEFKVILNMLSGQDDIGRSDGESNIESNTGLSASSVRTFVKGLVSEGYVTIKRYDGGPPVCFARTSPHNEYFLTDKGISYIKAEVKRWKSSGEFDKDLVGEILQKVEKWKKKQR